MPVLKRWVISINIYKLRLNQRPLVSLQDPECRDLVASTEIVEGDPAAEILRKADELGADLVVMGTHGKGVLEHAFLGSVAEKVLQRIKIPILTIPIPKDTDIRFNDF
jgi:nucleotide-binding universal stress UspA family protein